MLRFRSPGPWALTITGLLVAIGLRADTVDTAVIVSSPVVPPGGTAQITIHLPAAVPITHGRFQIDLDPLVFGDISAIHVFSASGDQQGVARLQGRHADVVFDSNSGGIGRLPDTPVAGITVPVIDTARGIGTVRVQAPSLWRDASGKQRRMSFESPGVTVGPGLSIERIVPGGGQLSAGTVVEIRGRGFTESTRLRLAGISWSNLQVVSSSLLTITLMGPGDLTGK